MTMYSVKEFWELTSSQYSQQRLVTPKGTGISTGGSTIHKPHRSLVMAVMEMRFRSIGAPRHMQFKIVDHDDEMRRWRRWDWIKNPTPEERELAANMRGVIPSIAPGESVVIPVKHASRSNRTDEGV